MRESPVCAASTIRSAPRRAELLMKDKFKIGDRVSWNSEVRTEAPHFEIKNSKTEDVACHRGSALTRLRD
jgi:hypothetical protein